MTVVLISKSEDEHLPYITKHLPRDGYVVVDAQAVVDGKSSLSYAVSRGKVAVSYGGNELKHVTGVLVRRPRLIEDLNLPVETHHNAYAASALNWHMNQLYVAFPGAYWISDYYAIQRAENKLYQLQVAATVGFEVPETLLTSDAARARKFVASNDASIVKPIARVFSGSTDGKHRMLLATKISRSQSQHIDYSGLRVAPTFFQQAVDFDFDIRVTVIGAEVFAAKVKAYDHRRNATTRDWKVGYYHGSVQLEPYALPKAVARKCTTLVKKLGLHYGAIDLIRDKNGTFWFLEIDPNGQWAFVEEETGLPLGKTMAQLLMDGPR